MFTRAFWLDTAERAARTFAQTWLVTTASTEGGLLHVSWAASLSVAGFAALATVVSAVAYPAKSAPTGTPAIEPDAIPHAGETA